MNSSILQLALDLGTRLRERKLQCSVAESCTGGGLAAAITAIEGSSQWFERGFVTYSNEAKEEMLGVDHQVLSAHGAVSQETAQEMAQGAILNSNADISVAITGIAGPGGGTKEKPIGTVWIACAGNLKPIKTQQFLFQGDRSSVREQAVKTALQGLIERCREPVQSSNSNDRYFFALYPSSQKARELHQQTSSMLEKVQCKPMPIEKLHLTLVYLGQVLDSAIQDCVEMAAQLKGEKFILEINDDGHWQHNKIRWLGIKQAPKELLDLVNGLKKIAISAGFKPERRCFAPHITIARDCQEVQGRISNTVVWEVSDFCLVKSITENPSRYEIIQRWGLV